VADPSKPPSAPEDTPGEGDESVDEDNVEVLEPIRIVERELTGPDGTKMRVKVPVYAPFQLEKRHAKPAPLRRIQRGLGSPRAKAEEG